MSAVMTAPVTRPEDDGNLEALDPLDTYAEEVGRRIVRARKELGLTQVEMARKVGVSQRSAQAWETGETIPYRWTKKLARVLKREPEWILHGPEGEDESRLARLELKVDELTRLLQLISKKLG